MTTAQIHAAVLHGMGQTPRYELFPAPGPPTASRNGPATSWSG